MLKRGIDVLYLDFMRTTYNPHFEHVEPIQAAYQGGLWNKRTSYIGWKLLRNY